MGMIRCDANEHFYDPTKHSSCPYCTTNRATDEGTMAMDMGNKTGNEDKTKLRDERNPADNDSPYNTDGAGSNPDATVGVWGNKKTTTSETEQRAIFEEAPVVGWIVVVSGEGQGKDFRIIPGINTIGRDTKNTIMIDTGDNAISRDAHCIIEYDIKNNDFYLERGSNSTHLNGGRVGGDGTKLEMGDTIEIGDTKLRFVPLCDNEFNWDM